MNTNVGKWLVWSIEHTAWWRPGRWGYTHDPAEAGRYSRAEAEAIVTRANIITINECAIPATAVDITDETLCRLMAKLARLDQTQCDFVEQSIDFILRHPKHKGTE